MSGAIAASPPFVRLALGGIQDIRVLCLTSVHLATVSRDTSGYCA